MTLSDGGDDAAHALRQRGNAAFKEGRYQDAFDCYAEALSSAPDDEKLLCNRAAAGLRLHSPEQALRDAAHAERVLRTRPGTVDTEWLKSLAKACFLQGGASLRLGDVRAACVRLRMAVLLVPDDEGALRELREAADTLSNAEIAQLAAAAVSAGESLSAFSTRDGKLMKRLPEDARFSFRGLVQHIQDALLGSEELARNCVFRAWSAPDSSGALHARHMLLTFRGAALLKAHKCDLALKDTRAAVAFMPAEGCAFALATHAAALEAAAARQPDGVIDVQHGGVATRVPLRTAVAIALCRASQVSPFSEACVADFQSSLQFLPELHAQVLQDEGVAALLARIQQQHDASLPEYKRPQPKYAAYFSWMARRIEERFPQLDDASRDTLLCMDAGELDLLLDPKNAHLDAAALMHAAQAGLGWTAFEAMGRSDPVSQLLNQ